MQIDGWKPGIIIAGFCAAFGILYAQERTPSPEWLKPVDIGPTGIEIKRPVFAGACKACPWGVLAAITQAALKPDGYDVKICWVCWSNFGPREMADKAKPIIPPGAGDNPSYVEAPPDAVPDISATSEMNLIDAWNGEGVYANDHKQRRNYRIVALVQQPNFFMIAANRKSGITDLSQVKDRDQPTWVASTSRDNVVDEILAYYGISETSLKAKGGGFIRTQDREKRAAADLFVGGVVLANTPEQRMWYEVSQLDDLVFFNLPDPLLAKLEGRRGYVRATAPIAFLRGVERPIPTLMRSVHAIYVRDEAPDSFTYTLAKALDQHQDLFRMYGDPWYYDVRIVASSKVIPMAHGALRYYKERGYVK
ncbi:MAG: TAXI family TRAP transporter solute-binding subunit [Bryobacteraceae bacterium]